MKNLISEFIKDLNELSQPLIDFCDNCGKKRKLTFWESGRRAWCNKCWSDWDKFEKKQFQEYQKEVNLT